MNNKRRYIIQCLETRQSGVTTVITTVEYNLLDSFNSYTELTPLELGELSDIEYDTRLNDFIDYIDGIDSDVKNQLISTSTFFDPSCVESLEVIDVIVSCL